MASLVVDGTEATVVTERRGTPGPPPGRSFVYRRGALAHARQ
jgi:hypothetical protein